MAWTVEDKNVTLNGVAHSSVTKQMIIDKAKELGYKTFIVLLDGEELSEDAEFPITEGAIEIQPHNVAA